VYGKWYNFGQKLYGKWYTPLGGYKMSERLTDNTIKTEVIIQTEKAESGTKERCLILDAETGEIYDAFWKVNHKKLPGRNAKKPHFIKLYRTNWVDIVKKKKLSIHEAGLLVILMAYIDWQSPYLVHPDTGENLNEKEIADLLGIHRGHLHNQLDSLCSKGLIAKINKGKGSPNNYMINSNVFFFGSAIKDINDHLVFTKDCEYIPPVVLKYKEAVFNSPDVGIYD
jgi:hypothetical protein